MFQVFAHGHREETLFICRFDVSRQLVTGENLLFKAKASWLTCYKTCVPAFADLEILIPVESEPQRDNKWNPLFEKFRAECNPNQLATLGFLRTTLFPILIVKQRSH